VILELSMALLPKLPRPKLSRIGGAIRSTLMAGVAVAALAGFVFVRGQVGRRSGADGRARGGL